MRASLQYYFGLELRGTKSTNAEQALHHLDKRLSRIRKTWGITPESELMRSEFNLALSTLPKVYDATRDTVLGAAVPIEFVYPKRIAGIEWSITHRLDAVFARNRKVKGGMESYVLFNMEDPLDPIGKRTYYSELTHAFLSYVARDQLKLQTGLPIEVVDFYMALKPVHKILLPDGRTEFEAFVDNSLALMATGAAIPVGDPVKCMHCPYWGFCKPSSASVTRGIEDRTERQRLRRALRDKVTGLLIRRPSGD